MADRHFSIRSAALLLAALLVFGLAVPAFPARADDQTAYGEGPSIYGEGYCVMDAETGDILAAHNAMGMFYPASITKTLTALVVAEHVTNWEDIITFSDNAVNGVSEHSSTIEPKPFVGEQMTVRNVMFGMMLASCNCCAEALAEYVAGSRKEFAKLMNAKCEELGTTNSHFVNPHGLDNYEHYTNPYDMCLIARAAIANPDVRYFMSTPKATLPATNAYGATRVVTMGHKMINGEIPFEGVFAGKTGRTANAGRTLVTVAEHNGHQIICVLMKSTEEYFYTDAEILLDYAYDIVDGQEPMKWVPCEDEMVAVTNCNLRMKPSEYAVVRGSLMATQKVVVNARYANWSRLEIDGKTYYCRSDMLAYPDGTPSPITTAPTEGGQPTTEPPAESTAPAQTEPQASSVTEESPMESGETAGTSTQEAAVTQTPAPTSASGSTAAAVTEAANEHSGDSRRALQTGLIVAAAVIAGGGILGAGLYARVVSARKKRIRKSNRHRSGNSGNRGKSS